MIIFSNSNAQFNSNTISFLEDPYYEPVDMVVDIEQMSCRLEINPYKQIVDGNATFNFKTLRTKTDSIIFTTYEIIFNEVKINNQLIKFKKLGDRTILYPDKNLLEYDKNYTLTIDYTANPNIELYFSGWNDPTNRKKKQIWAHGPSHWLPFINQKHDLLKTELFVTFDENYKVFSNGDRVSVTNNKNKTKTWHYKLDKPHVVYLICLVIGNYDYYETKSKSGVPIELWYYPEQKDRILTTYMYMEQMIDFFEEETGIKYPWKSYRQAPLVDYLYGGMETTTATVFGDYMFIDGRGWWMRNYVNVNAHELNHQWFGNLVSHLNNPHVWLTESFATYYAKLFERSLFGDDYYQWERTKELTRVMNAAKFNNKPIGNSSAGSDRWYPKGSLVLDMMRDIMGDSEFRAAIKYYVEQNYHKVTSTSDFLRAIREKTGYALDWFFEQWIERGGEPKFEVDYSIIQKNNKNYVAININQIHIIDQLIKAFKVPITIDVYFSDNSKISYKNWINDKITNFEIEIPHKEVSFVIFDPNRKIIKTIVFQRNFNQLINQAQFAENMIDRYDALLELRTFDIDMKREIYSKLYHKEKYHLTKSEIINQLINDSLSLPLIAKAISDGDEWVVRTIVENMKIVPSNFENEYSKILKDSCYINVELALENLTNSFPNRDYFEITKSEVGWRGKNIRSKWLELNLSRNFEQKELLDELIDYTSPSFEFETRINSLNALRKLNYLNEKIILNLAEGYYYWNNKLRPTCLEILQYFMKQNKYRNMIITTLDNSKYKKLINLIK